MPIRSLAIFFSLWLFSACGYSFAGVEKAPRGVTRVFVNQAMDAALDVGPAAALTRALRERIDVSTALKNVALVDAEAVLEARIESTVDLGAPVASEGPPTTQKYVLGMVGSLRMIDRSGAVVWQSGGVRVDEDYASGLPACTPGPCAASVIENNVPMTEANRRRALEHAAEELAKELYARLVESF
jgi:hypothetical protein